MLSRKSLVLSLLQPSMKSRDVHKTVASNLGQANCNLRGFAKRTRCQKNSWPFSLPSPITRTMALGGGVDLDKVDYIQSTYIFASRWMICKIWHDRKDFVHVLHVTIGAHAVARWTKRTLYVMTGRCTVGRRWGQTLTYGSHLWQSLHDS